MLLGFEPRYSEAEAGTTEKPAFWLAQLLVLCSPDSPAWGGTVHGGWLCPSTLIIDQEK